MRFHTVAATLLALTGVTVVLWSIPAASTASSEQVFWRLLAAFLFVITAIIVASVGVAAGKILAEIRKSQG